MATPHRKQRSDFSQTMLPHSAYLDDTFAYLVFARNFFFEGPTGADSHTLFACFKRSRANECTKRITITYWQGASLERHMQHEAIICDEMINLSYLNALLSKYVQRGIMDIRDQQENYSTAQFADLIGAQVQSSVENWYSLVGPHHYTDGRHMKYMLPYFKEDFGIEQLLSGRHR
jgi:hypothetical protein